MELNDEEIKLINDMEDSIENSSNNLNLTLENTIGTLLHFPKHILAISLLEAIKFNQMIDPRHEFKISEKKLDKVDHQEVFSFAMLFIKSISDDLDEANPNSLNLSKDENLLKRVH